LHEHLKGKRHCAVAKLSLLHVATVHSCHEHCIDKVPISYTLNKCVLLLCSAITPPDTHCKSVHNCGWSNFELPLYLTRHILCLVFFCLQAGKSVINGVLRRIRQMRWAGRVACLEANE